jgi:hypothetical protein
MPVLEPRLHLFDTRGVTLCKNWFSPFTAPNFILVVLIPRRQAFQGRIPAVFKFLKGSQISQNFNKSKLFTEPGQISKRRNSFSRKNRSILASESRSRFFGLEHECEVKGVGSFLEPGFAFCEQEQPASSISYNNPQFRVRY